MIGTSLNHLFKICNRILIPNNIIVFTKDQPAIEGGGKSIRMMNWLAHLSSQYDQVHCIYFYSSSALKNNKDRLPGNVSIVSVRLIATNNIISFFRRCILGILKPYSYSLFWYEEINTDDCQIIHDLLMKSKVILFFRLYLFPVLIKFKNINPNSKSIALDMDDAETDTFRQIRNQEWSRGDYKKWLSSYLGSYYMNYYENHLPAEVTTLYYAHPQDVSRFKSKYTGKKVMHFANKVPIVPWTERHKEKNEGTILFVGSLNYYPNVDAVHYLITEIWPLILDKKKDAKLIIAGSKPGRNLKNLISQTKSVSLIENPKYIKDVFDIASILIVPLRLAGGTRIKVLQSFSYGVPVVSTSIGISGIAVRQSETGLIYDGAADLAMACVSLLTNPLLQRKIAKEAFNFYSLHHSFHI